MPAGNLSKAAFVGANTVNGPAPVSYTHLDVSKRQEIPGAGDHFPDSLLQKAPRPALAFHPVH